MRPARRIKDTGRASKQDSGASASERRSAVSTLPVFPKNEVIRPENRTAKPQAQECQRHVAFLSQERSDWLDKTDSGASTSERRSAVSTLPVFPKNEVIRPAQ